MNHMNPRMKRQVRAIKRKIMKEFDYPYGKYPKIKKVSFTDCTKKHDGLNYESHIFELIIKEYFILNTIKNQKDIKKFLKTKSDFEIVLKKFDDLIERSLKCENNVTVLPKGGGKALKIPIENFKFILALKGFVIQEYLNLLEESEAKLFLSLEEQLSNSESERAFELFRMLFSNLSIE